MAVVRCWLSLSIAIVFAITPLERARRTQVIEVSAVQWMSLTLGLKGHPIFADFLFTNQRIIIGPLPGINNPLDLKSSTEQLSLGRLGPGSIGSSFSFSSEWPNCNGGGGGEIDNK